MLRCFPGSGGAQVSFAEVWVYSLSRYRRHCLAELFYQKFQAAGPPFSFPEDTFSTHQFATRFLCLRLSLAAGISFRCILYTSICLFCSIWRRSLFEQGIATRRFSQNKSLSCRGPCDEAA